MGLGGALPRCCRLGGQCGAFNGNTGMEVEMGMLGRNCTTGMAQTISEAKLAAIRVVSGCCGVASFACSACTLTIESATTPMI